jgi:hypothetical protein
MSDIGQFAMFLAVGLGFLGFFFSPIGGALGRWIESKSRKGGDPERFQELEARVVELEANCERMAEIEERLDFAERLLAQQRDPKELGR